jgi:hypothetical protein
MRELTRRRSPDARDECWPVFYGDVRVGTIPRRVGIPNAIANDWLTRHRSGAYVKFTQAGADLFA